MEQIVLNVENKNILPSLKRVLGSIEGVTIVKMPHSLINNVTTYGHPNNVSKKKKTGLELAIEDVEHGRVSRVFTSVDEMFKSLED